jgi:uncharacterized protein CXXCG
MATRFWKLSGPARDAALADWTDEVDLEQVVCPKFPNHQRAGRRITPLSVVLPAVVTDFVWTWGGDCLIQSNVLQALREAGISGFSVSPVKARFDASRSRSVPELWELGITGWGGVAPPESGIKLDEARSCRYCGHLVYTDFTDASRLIDLRAWDGSDCFILWPLPRYFFVTDRARNVIESEEFTGVSFTDVNDLKKPSGVIAGFSPGRLSYWLSQEAARRIGGPLGID